MTNAQSVWLDGTLHVGGGYASQGIRVDARLYSLIPGVDSTWTVMDTPTYYYALAVHGSELLLVGGIVYSTKKTTNKLFTIKDRDFRESLPPMKEARAVPSVISNGTALVVAGGLGTSKPLASVEVLKDGQWTTAPSLPRPGYHMNSVLNGDLWYIIHQVKSVFRVSLRSLTSGTVSLAWETLPDAPNSYSAAAFFGGRLLSIGGGERREPTPAIHALSSSSQSWEHVADLPVPLRELSTIVLPTEEALLVIGGSDKRENSTSTISGAYLKGNITL